MDRTVLTESVWRERSARHLQRAEQWTIPAKSRHARGFPHPVDDFLFTYYRFSFGKLEQWHPRHGTVLEVEESLPAHFRRTPYVLKAHSVRADPAELTPKARARLVWIHDLLSRTRDRKPNFACHGIHEWAMVYRGTDVRHATKLRLPQPDIDKLVEDHPIACSHFDAFRFFHAEAQPLNRLQPALDTRQDFEQPACVHANMDLYKWAFKAMPWIGSELLLDCFELALELRELDMRASPYDLAEYGLTPIPIESPEGRTDYEVLQAELARKAAPLRLKLIECLGELISTWPATAST
ncbi:MAG: 3-methyladenine DNA glycosylase [Verrucomicrobiota bacterium]